MSGTGSADDQSEDGELRQSPNDKKQSDALDFRYVFSKRRYNVSRFSFL